MKGHCSQKLKFWLRNGQKSQRGKKLILDLLPLDITAQYLSRITATHFSNIPATYLLDIIATFLLDITATFRGHSLRNTGCWISITWQMTFFGHLFVTVLLSARAERISVSRMCDILELIAQHLTTEFLK